MRRRMRGVPPLYPNIETGPDCVLHYKLWAGLTSPGKVFDYSLNGNIGTVTNAVPRHPGFSFDGNGDLINAGSDSSIDDIFVGGGTISLWLWSDGRGQNNEGRCIGKSQWILTMSTDATTMEFKQNFTGDDGQWRFTIESGKWFHIAIVYNNDLGANDPIIYINGLPVTINEVNAPGSDTDTTDSGEILVVGDNDNLSGCWDGRIGDVLMFNTMKSAQQARSIFESSRWRYGV